MKTNLKQQNLYEKVRQTIAREGLIAPGDKVWVAVSGGADSMALLHVLAAITNKEPVTLGILHVHHGLRPASDVEWGFVENTARTLGMPFFGERTDVLRRKEEMKMSVEETAREERLRIYQKALSETGFTKVATAHHADDQAELFFLRLFRGSGTLGLSGMAYQRPKGLIRPFLEVQKKEILDFMNEQALLFCEDESNADMRFDRNRIRHKLLPLLEEEYAPQIKEALHRLSQITREEEMWLAKITQEAYEKAVKKDGDSYKIELNVFQTFSIALQRRLLRNVILNMNGNLRRITFDHIADIVRLTCAVSTEPQTVNLPGICVVRKNQTLWWLKKKEGQRFCEDL